MSKSRDRAPTNTLVVGTTTPISVIDPRAAHDFTSHIVIPQLYESPFARVADRFEPRLVVGQPVPCLDRGLQGFALVPRTDLRFSDGSPLGAGELADSMQAALASAAVGVAVVDDHIVLTGRAWPHRPEELLSLRRAAVLKETAYAPLGTGPFMLAEKSAEQIRLVRNPFALRQPLIDEVVVRWYPCAADGAPRDLITALDTGEVDFTMSLSRDDVGGLKRIRKLFQAGMSTAYLALNTERPYFARAELRRKIAGALDRRRLAELCYANPLAFVARGVLPPGLGGGADGLRYDPVKASAGEAELPPRLRMVRVWGPRPYLPRPDDVAAAIAAQLRAVGVTVETVAATDSEHYLELLTAGDYDLALCGWVADTTDPVDYLEAVLGEQSIPLPGRPCAASGNYSRWRDDETERHLLDARKLGSSRAIQEIQARVCTEVPLVPLMHGPRVVAHAWRVKGYDPAADLFPDFSVLELDDARRR